MLQKSMPLIPCKEKFCFDKSSFVESSCEILCLKLLCLKPPWPAAGVSCELTGQLSSSQCFSPELSEELCASHPAGFTHLPPTLSFVDTLLPKRSKIRRRRRPLREETQQKFETRPTNNQWRTSAEMSRNPNAEMQVIFFCSKKSEYLGIFDHIRCSCLRSSTSFAWCWGWRRCAAWSQRRKSWRRLSGKKPSSAIQTRFFFSASIPYL